MSKVVLITGGSSGIGKAVGEYLTKKGFVVYGTSRNPENYNKNFPFSLLKMEVTQIDSISEAIATIIKNPPNFSSHIINNYNKIRHFLQQKQTIKKRRLHVSCI